MKIAYGTSVGHTHSKLNYNNQDSVIVKSTDDYLIGIVTDGCGSGANSEVGAQLGAQFLANYIEENINNNYDWTLDLESMFHTYTESLIKLHGNAPKDFTKNFLLFTIIGIVIYKNKITVFSCGDGIIIIDEKIDIINQNNRPKYINNKFLKLEHGIFDFNFYDYTNQRLLIGTDGIEDLIEGMNNKDISEYNTIDSFLQDDRNYDNPIAVPKLLMKYSLKGVLRDDSTLIMIK